MDTTPSNITGTVTVSLDAANQTAIATFEVPVATALNPDEGIVLHGALDTEIRQAMANALTEAANNILSTLPTADSL